MTMHPEEAALRSALMDLKNKSTYYKDWATAESLEGVLQKVDALMATVLVPTGERYRHEKRGTVYDIYGFGHVNVSGDRIKLNGELRGNSVVGIPDRDEIVIYRDVQSGHIGIRPTEEFADGRFTLLPQRTGRPPVEHPQTVAAALGKPAPVKPRATRAEPALGAPYGAESKRVKFKQHGHIMHGKSGTVVEWLDQGKVRVLFDGNEVPVVVPSLNISSASEDGEA